MAVINMAWCVAIIATLPLLLTSADAAAIQGAEPNAVDPMKRDRDAYKRVITPACRGVGAPCTTARDCCEPWICGIDRSGSALKRCK
jgi:hypothetical protein